MPESKINFRKILEEKGIDEVSSEGHLINNDLGA